MAMVQLKTVLYKSFLPIKRPVENSASSDLFSALDRRPWPAKSEGLTLSSLGKCQSLIKRCTQNIQKKNRRNVVFNYLPSSFFKCVFLELQSNPIRLQRVTSDSFSSVYCSSSDSWSASISRLTWCLELSGGE